MSKIFSEELKKAIEIATRNRMFSNIYEEDVMKKLVYKYGEEKIIEILKNARNLKNDDITMEFLFLRVLERVNEQQNLEETLMKLKLLLVEDQEKCIEKLISQSFKMELYNKFIKLNIARLLRDNYEGYDISRALTMLNQSYFDNYNLWIVEIIRNSQMRSKLISTKNYQEFLSSVGNFIQKYLRNIERKIKIDVMTTEELSVFLTYDEPEKIDYRLSSEIIEYIENIIEEQIREKDLTIKIALKWYYLHNISVNRICGEWLNLTTESFYYYQKKVRSAIIKKRSHIDVPE